MKYALNLAWLYPSLMGTYSDRGNIMVFVNRMRWRGIQVNLSKIEASSTSSDLKNADLIFGGGAQDRQQEIVIKDLTNNKKSLLIDLINNKNIPCLFTCGSLQLLGNYYEPTFGQRIKGLGILDLISISPEPGTPRCIGNIIININKSQIPINNDQYLVGFENHGGRTTLGSNCKPLGKVIKGFGNNGVDKTEGAIFKNVIATYLHGPVLPKNVHLADYLIKLALENKYQKNVELIDLEDDLEWQAHRSVINKILGK